MRDRAPLREAFANRNVYAFSMAVRGGESGLTDRAYYMRYDGPGRPPAYFESLAKHPRVPRPTRDGKTSTAAGAYQGTWTTWSEEQERYGWPDFSVQSQDEFFVARLIYRKALDAVMQGKFQEACYLCRNEWTSLPGGPEQNSATSKAMERYLQYGGSLSPVSTPATPAPAPQPKQEKKSVDPLTALSLISTIGPYIVGLIPQVKKLFDPSVPVAERNVGAAVAVLQTITEVAKTDDIHAAVASMKSDPVLRQEVTNAVLTNPEVAGLLEIGGGIIEARKANAEMASQPLFRDRAFIFGVLFIGIVVMLLVDFLFVHPINYDGNLRTQIVTGVLGLAAIVGAYFFGTSQGSQRKTDILANKE